MGVTVGGIRRWIAGTLVVAAGLAGCTYAPAVPLIRVANSARRLSTDSVAMAVYVARMSRPTGVAAFPDGGRPLVENEYALFYLCVAPPSGPVTLRRLTSLPRPREMTVGFTPWIARWEGSDAFTASLRGYAGPESDPSTFRVRWVRVSLADSLLSEASQPSALPPASSLPPACESASAADARLFLDGVPRRR